MARVRVNPADTSAATAERIELELRAYNRSRRVRSISHTHEGIKPPTFEWAKNDWLVGQIRKKVGRGE